MWLRIIVCLVCFLCLFLTGMAEDLPPKSTIGLIYATNIDYVLASWDTVYVVIVDSVGGLVDTVWLSSNGNGIWAGSYLLDGLPSGSYTKIIHYDYGGDVYGEREAFAIIDTSELQGTASGLGAGDVAEAVKCTATAHPEIWTDQVGGTGADTFNIYVFDGDTTAIEGVNITVYNKGHTAVAGILTTDVNGLAPTFQDADTFHLYLQRLGVIYTEWDTIVVSNQGIDTIWVTAYDIGSSPSANVTRVKGFTRTYGYQKTDRVIVSFSTHDKNLIDTTAGVFIDKIDEVTYSDTGFFQVDLIPSISLLSKQPGITKDSIRYDVKMYAPGRSVFEWQNIFVPDSSGCVWLKDILE